ncbi:MAG: shikimate kinase [Chitinophagaceae bacterium]
MKIFLIGFMGSGKTHWGLRLSKKLSIPFYDLDEQIVEQEGKSVNEIFEANGEEYFRQLEKETLHIITESHDSLVMACGGGTPCYFNNIEYMNQAGTTVWLDTPVAMLFERLLKGKAKRPLLKDLSDEQLRSYIIKKFSDRKIYYEQAGITIQENKIELDRLIEKIFHV